MDFSKLTELIHQKYSIRLLILFGSRAQGIAREESDWDFGFIANKDFDEEAFYTELVIFLKTEKIDLVNLLRANALLRFRAAKDAIVIFEQTKGEFEKFWFQAVDFWCDAGPIIRAEYDNILKRANGKNR